jgi:hypothetical protein
VAHLERSAKKKRSTSQMLGWSIVLILAVIGTLVGVAQVIYGAVMRKKKHIIFGLSWTGAMWIGIAVLGKLNPAFMGDWP